MSASLDRHTRLYDEIDAKIRIVRAALLNSSTVNRSCFVIFQKATKTWPGSAKQFKQRMRKPFATRLQKAQETLEKGTPIWSQLNAIIQLLLPPQFADVCNDILDMWMQSTNESEKLMDKLVTCVGVWSEAVERGRYGSLDSLTCKTIFADLLYVVQTLQKEPDMINNIRLQYVVKFISDLRTELDRRPMTMKNPEAVFMYVKGEMTQYAPPYAPPVLHVETVAEEDEDVEEEPATEAHPHRVRDDALWQGDGHEIPMEADMSTLLRQMKQLCV